MPSPVEFHGGAHSENEEEAVVFAKFFCEVAVDASHVFWEGAGVKSAFRQVDLTFDLPGL